MRVAYQQAHLQSCTAVTIIVTLMELGIKAFNPAVSGLELPLHNTLKRSTRLGEEEIMPHKAVEVLRENGLQMTVIQDKSRTAVLKSSAGKMYQDYKGGLKEIGIPRVTRAITLDDFKDNARIFLIVGFFDRSGLKLHTVLGRLDGGNYYVMNPDGASDTLYSGPDLSGFLNAAVMTGMPPNPNLCPFAGISKNYIYT